MAMKRSKRRWKVQAECPLCKLSYIAERFTRPASDLVHSVCETCRAEISESQHRLKKRTPKVWVRCLSRLNDRGRSHIASVAWWEFAFMPWIDFEEAFPFVMVNEGVSDNDILRGLVRVGFGRRHAEYKVYKERQQREGTANAK